jgi:O-antigen/teichoic acid export membrane protein
MVTVVSTRKNIISNYISQIYVSFIGIAILPLYIQYMGTEAYGLIGFFAMLQSIFMLLDLGLTPTISRETARYQVKAITEDFFKSLYKALSYFFLLIATSGAVSLYFLAHFFTNHWLKTNHLPHSEVLMSLQIMGCCIAIRWLSGLYRGIIMGSEKITWLSYFNILFASFKFLLVFLVMYQFGFTPMVFFTHQLVISVLELLVLAYKAKKLLHFSNQANHFSLKPLKSVLKFSISIAITSAIWVLVTQTDKLILSGILPLSEYAYYTLAVLLASGLIIISTPISTVIMPRMASLHAQNKTNEMLKSYKAATQLISILVGSASITIIFMAKPILLAWTGNQLIADKSTVILQLYALGNVFLAWGAFPYYLQYAKGNLRYHVIGNILTVVILIPCIILAARQFGGIGAGVIWFLLNALFFILWVPYVHQKIAPGLHKNWLTDDILKIITPTIIIIPLLTYLLPKSDNRLINIVFIIVILCLSLLISLMNSNYKTKITKYVRKTN